jgi:hypothetical protein
MGVENIGNLMSTHMIDNYKKSIYFKNIHIKSKYNKLKLKTYIITIINEKIYFNFIIKGITL